MCKEYFLCFFSCCQKFLSHTYTSLYIQEQGRTFVHTMNSLVVQQHFQNIKMRGQNLMLNQILATVGVNVPLQIKHVPDILYLTNISTTSTYDMPHPPTYDHLYSHFLPKNEVKKKLVTYKKYFIPLIKIENSDFQLGRPKLIQLLIFWFENLSFLCTMNSILNGYLILKRKKNQI